VSTSSREWVAARNELTNLTGKGKAAVSKLAKDIQWELKDIEVDHEDIYQNPLTIYHRTLKKVGDHLKPDHTGLMGSIGWAIWIEEDFVVPWYVPFTMLTISIGIFVFAAWYTAEAGTLKANGWTIGSFLLAAVTLSFNAWVSWAKDSKHPRI
jgi:hypothetical protein